MSSIIETLNKIRDEFSIFSDPRDKYIFLVDLAKDLDGLSQEEKVEENRSMAAHLKPGLLVKKMEKNIFFKQIQMQ
ncbi:MAG: hypothetical protein Ct9H300mP18_05630 [Candidatus Neomarinimicrobiota bacterium]|nr:MAG: hypothetical protein Ct9H300mP18_05630 [Candidatus Neomarinimicrobiota bacterium]